MLQPEDQVPQRDQSPIEPGNLRHRMQAHARDLLAQCPVLTVSEFEGRLLAAFPEAREMTEVLRSGRLRNLNLVDWVKADLTRSGVLHYLGRGEGRLVVYLPVVGQIQGDVLVSQSSALKVIRDFGVSLFPLAKQ